MPLLYIQRYTRQTLKDNPDKLFVFGDNSARVGTGGQAGDARGEPNAIGIVTKKAPTYNPADFLTDKEYVSNIIQIFKDFEPIFDHLYQGKDVVWPMDGIGTGRAALPEKAPNTLAFIYAIVNGLKNNYGFRYF